MITEVCVVAPEVALTVTLNVPTGVPLMIWTGCEPPPPQEAMPNTSAIPNSSIPVPRKLRRLRDGTPKRTSPRNPKPVIAANVVVLTGHDEATVRAVVEIVKVVVAALPFGVTVGGLKVQLVAVGNPEQAKLTALAKPPCGVTEMLYVAG